ncbi:hypothetical protein OEZ60_20725 [Defluviimonas sp. WL0024]|uniref:Uncharacterized protein n=2 Tax=Albidovulum TaxID=205889 RepID=A0ABT2X8Y6_9RHOB|nr:hypothetical protein [Defluviimonas sp. WL0024]
MEQLAGDRFRDHDHRHRVHRGILETLAGRAQCAGLLHRIRERGIFRQERSPGEGRVERRRRMIRISEVRLPDIETGPLVQNVGDLEPVPGGATKLRQVVTDGLAEIEKAVVSRRWWKPDGGVS